MSSTRLPLLLLLVATFSGFAQAGTGTGKQRIYNKQRSTLSWFVPMYPCPQPALAGRSPTRRKPKAKRLGKSDRWKRQVTLG